MTRFGPRVPWDSGADLQENPNSVLSPYLRWGQPLEEERNAISKF